MNYYEHHLGDYLKDTLHLTMVQEGAYRRLLDSYYSRESGIPKDQVYLIARASTKAERGAVDAVLKEFFRLSGKVWIKDRCEQEIASAHRRIQAAIENGRKGGRPRNPEETQRKPSGLAKQNPTHNPTPNPEESSPDSILHTPNNKNKNSEGINPVLP